MRNGGTFGQAAVVNAGTIYDLGGCTAADTSTFSCDSGDFQNTVYSFTVSSSDGSPNAWSGTGALNSFSTGVDWLNAYVNNGYIYIMGGCSGTAASNFWGCGTISSAVQYAPILSNGTLGTWVTLSSLSTAQYNAGGFVANNYLYTIGGCTTTSTTNARGCGTAAGISNGPQYVAINADGGGAPTSWPTNTVFRTARSGYASAVYNGYLYVLGGAASSSSTGCTASGNTCNDVLWAQLSSSGAPGSWTDQYSGTGSFTNARTYLTAQAYNGYLYIMGGLQSGTYYNDTQYAPICTGINTVSGCTTSSTPGSVGNWTDLSSGTGAFTTARYFLASAAYNGYLYILGGEASSSDGTGCQTVSYGGSTYLCNDVQYALICTGSNNGTAGCGSTPGSVGTWNYTYNSGSGSFSGGFSTPRYGLGVTVYNGYLYVVSGTNGNVTPYVDIQYAPLNANGTVGTWNYTTAPNLGSDYGAGVVAYNGYLYLTGGSYYFVLINPNVQYAPLNANGTVGNWTAFPTSVSENGGTANAYNGYLYIIGGNGTTTLQYAGLQSMPQIARYSYLVTNGDTNDTPIEATVAGTNTGNAGPTSIGGFQGTNLEYRFADTCTNLPFNTANVLTYGTKFTYTTDGCSVATNLAEYTWLELTIDDTTTFTFPDTSTYTSNHTTITGLTEYYHPASGQRLRGGATFTGGNLQSLDAPP
jgi:hypothetical protein